MTKLELQQINDLLCMINFTIKDNSQFTINKKIGILLLKYIEYLKGE